LGLGTRKRFQTLWEGGGKGGEIWKKGQVYVKSGTKKKLERSNCTKGGATCFKMEKSKGDKIPRGNSKQTNGGKKKLKGGGDGRNTHKMTVFQAQKVKKPGGEYTPKPKIEEEKGFRREKGINLWSGCKKWWGVGGSRVGFRKKKKS